MTIHYSKTTGWFYDSDIHAVLPEDAIEISADTHARLMEAQSSGQIIAADADGFPVATDPPAPGAEVLAAQVRARRDALIAATDYLVMPDYPISAKALKDVKVYRQALRDITAQAGFPQEVVWPTMAQL